MFYISLPPLLLSLLLSLLSLPLSSLSPPSLLPLPLPLSLPLLFQLAVVPECNIFLGLSDGEVFYADLETFTILGSLPKSRGATYFAVDWQKLRGRVGFGRELRVGVSTKKRLQLYEWKRNMFNITKVHVRVDTYSISHRCSRKCTCTTPLVLKARRSKWLECMCVCLSRHWDGFSDVYDWL